MPRSCNKCGELKSEEDFNKLKGSKDGLHYNCRLCCKTYYREYYKKNAKKIAKYGNKWIKNNPEKRRESWFRSRYKIELEDRDKMAELQDNKCKICKKEKELYVDHCHKTGRIRGLLCHNCNASLGLMKENVHSLKNLLNYVEENCLVSIID